jgi:hypothetical protein
VERRWYSCSRRGAPLSGQAKEGGGRATEDPVALGLGQHRVEADRVWLGHVEWVVGPETQMIGAMRLDEKAQLRLIEHEGVKVEPT